MAKMLKRYNTKKTESDADRFSDLPQPILHHILSFLDMKQVVHTSLLSRRWRYLWISVPCLNFDHLLWNKIRKKQNRGIKEVYKEGFMDFVDKVLFLRDNSNIHKFHLSCGDYCNSSRIEAWVTALARRNVEELHIEIYGAQPVELGPYVFVAPIRVFKLRSDYCDLVQLPNSMCSAGQLRTLQLIEVKLPGGDLNGELLLCCPSLENLIIKRCNHKNLKFLNISTFRLENLVLVNNGWSYRNSCKIRICAPNLTSFKYYEGASYVYNDYCLEDLSSLVSAQIDLIELPSNVNAECQIIKLLKGLCLAECLTLSDWWIQASSNLSGILFHNLWSLKLINWRKSYCLHSIANLLESTPNIGTLDLNLAEVCSSDKGGDWDALLSFNCMFSYLKSVYIRNLQGCEDELKFLEFLLKNAMVLENLDITTSKTMSMNTEKQLTEFSNKLQKLPKVSSSVTIFFLLKSRS